MHIDRYTALALIGAAMSYSSPKPWVGVGLRARERLGAPPRACSLRLAVTAGCRLVPLDNPFELRVRGDIALDLDQALRDVRGNVALGLAGYLLEREGVLEQLGLEEHNQALADVAIELVLPRDELERVWRDEAGDLEAVLRHYAQHVPVAWVLRLVERIEDAAAPV